MQAKCICLFTFRHKRRGYAPTTNNRRYRLRCVVSRALTSSPSPRRRVEPRARVHPPCDRSSGAAGKSRRSFTVRESFRVLVASILPNPFKKHLFTFRIFPTVLPTPANETRRQRQRPAVATTATLGGRVRARLQIRFGSRFYVHAARDNLGLSRSWKMRSSPRDLRHTSVNKRALYSRTWSEGDRDVREMYVSSTETNTRLSLVSARRPFPTRGRRATKFEATRSDRRRVITAA